MRIIGLTGPSGAGKSTLCEKFEELGIPCINTDDIYHEITSKPSPCLKELEKAFGSAVINENGSLDRTALARLVWEETNARLTQYMKKRKKAAVIDAPALFSSRVFIGACSFIISVLCDKETRIERIVARDGITREQALARINAQPDDEFFIKNSDYYINNSGNKSEMSRQLASIFEQEGMFF